MLWPGLLNAASRSLFPPLCFTTMASAELPHSPHRSFEIKGIVRHEVDETMSELASKLQAFEKQQLDTFNKLEVVVTEHHTKHCDIENKINAAEQRFNGVLQRVGEVMGTTEQKAMDNDGQLRKTIEQAHDVMRALIERISYVEKILCEAQQRQQADFNSIKEFAAQNREEIMNQSKRTVDSSNHLANQVEAELSSMGVGNSPGVDTGGGAKDTKKLAHPRETTITKVFEEPSRE